MRDLSELAAQLDLAYCLHWAVRDALNQRRAVSGVVDEQELRCRRLALEWLLTTDPWDEITLDT